MLDTSSHQYLQALMGICAGFSMLHKNYVEMAQFQYKGYYSLILHQTKLLWCKGNVNLFFQIIFHDENLVHGIFIPEDMIYTYPKQYLC